MSISLTVPLLESVIQGLKIGDTVTVSGQIYAGRDAVLPKLIKLAEQGLAYEHGIPLEGGVVFHSAVSIAGVGPTSSNKPEIESSIGPLSALGIRLHLGKGAIREETVRALADWGAVYAVIPPVTAMLKHLTERWEVAAFPEEGMEALYRLWVRDYPAIIAAARGESIYSCK